MRTLRLVALLCLWAAAQCDNRTAEDLLPSEVLTIETCPNTPTEGCYAVADGATLLPVRICTPVKELRVPKLEVAVTTTAGKWQSTSSAMATVSLSISPCADLLLLPDRKTAPIEIGARFSSIYVSRQVAVAASPIEAIDISTVPASLQMMGSSNLTVTARVRGHGNGEPTEGTLVRFELVEVQPAGTIVAFQTDRRLLSYDSSGGATAATSVMVGSRATALTLRLTAVPPVIDSAPVNTASFSQNLTILGAQ